ncbi:hypothetical protein CCH01_12150 [Clostridium chauvoei JF4335]|uniref:Uncharacterized protein n=1 Tax=Clostridium chauvoei JF4335 TaxID=1351755 RepID=A0A1U6JB14_9CLOT|nr:hypothetical protein CCH01_12150 [Clostridium chauvoei JF4335]
MKKQTRQKMIYIVTIIMTVMFSVSLLVSLVR